jgi:exodeoxyribonuclease VII small subunit
MAELETLVGTMEGGQMPLDRLLAGYQRGAQLLDYCRARLKAVEDQVRLLDEVPAEDGPAG